MEKHLPSEEGFNSVGIWGLLRLQDGKTWFLPLKAETIK